MNAFLASNQIIGMRQLTTVKSVPKLLNTTLIKEVVFAQLEIHFCKEEDVFHVHIPTTGMQFQVLVRIVLTHIFIVPTARNVFVQIAHLMNIMESALPVTILITGILPQICVLSAQKLMSLTSSKESVFVLNSYPMILASNVLAASDQNTGMKILKHVNSVHQIPIILKAS